MGIFVKTTGMTAMLRNSVFLVLVTNILSRIEGHYWPQQLITRMREHPEAQRLADDRSACQEIASCWSTKAFCHNPAIAQMCRCTCGVGGCSLSNCMKPVT